MKALAVFLAGIACALTFTRHDPQRVPLGFRCRKCGEPGTTEGELLGVDDQVRRPA